MAIQLTKRRGLSREDIDRFPEAKIGKRSCDVPLSPNEERDLTVFLQLRKHLHEAAARMIPGYDRTKRNHWRRVLEVLKATGLPVKAYDALNAVDEVHVVHAAAAMKQEHLEALANAIATIQKNHSPEAPTHPLSERERAVLNLIRDAGPNGITGKDIIQKLAGTRNRIEQSTLTRHVIPALKDHCHVKNRRNVGYFISGN